MDHSIDDLLRRAVDHGASDIHLKVGSAPVLRLEGELRSMGDVDPLTPADTEAYATAIFSEKAAADFAATGVADFAYGRHDLGRFRVTAFRQRGSVSLVLRRVSAGSRTFAELGLPRVIEKVASARSGLVLVTGASGSGKTTTISSIIDWINSNRSVAILTVEDPIEVLHPDKRSVVVQREVGVDTPDMAGAIRSAMRHDADVIMISELADSDTARAAIDAAETGHLVISSMRTTDPAETLTRLVSMFPDSHKPVVRSQLATQMQAIVSQLLVETSNGGRIMACEVLTNNERAQEWMATGDDAALLVDIIKESSFHGMQTFDQALLKHVVERTVDITAALPHVRNTHEIRAKAMAAGVAS
ncbi:MAG: PilT/PilU family type 4a pilus ATPase [Actinobacteria bacterium]|nr:PilT/PilU family type 4a pilus ATPase [Actinomycetota bacterium]MCI0678520.1 PilT/PilU family type 4a pilus ATPase [Actinomycetota bacterium]